MHGLVYGMNGADVLHQTVDVDRQAAGGYFASGDGGDQLPFRALRIFGFADDDVDADIAAGEPVHNFDCRRFVFINGDYRFLDAERPV